MSGFQASPDHAALLIRALTQADATRVAPPQMQQPRRPDTISARTPSYYERTVPLPIRQALRPKGPEAEILGTLLSLLGVNDPLSMIEGPGRASSIVSGIGRADRTLRDTKVADDFLGLAKRPPKSKVPPHDWARGDDFDDGTVKRIRKYFAGGAQDATIYQSYVPKDLVPEPYLWREGDSYDWDALRRTTGVPYPPIKIVIEKSGAHISDGHHRVTQWLQQGYSHIPAWIIDMRNVK